MKRLLQISLLTMFVATALLYLQLIANSHYLSSLTNFLRAWSLRKELLSPEFQLAVASEAYQRVELYEELIVAKQLDHGMVVNRDELGNTVGECDSLLFSALRFVALSKLQLHESAVAAWADIEHSQFAGHWYRHPRCRKHTSRDMIIGLLVALSQKPDHYRMHLKSFINYVRANRGFFGSGPMYVSFLTPALAELVRNLARIEGMAYHDLPNNVRSSFSTVELDAALTAGGYKSHLVALLAWLEFELDKNYQPMQIRSAARDFSMLTNPFTMRSLSSQRLEYIAQRLVETDPRNLFFKYLRLRSANALSPAVRQGLLAELLSMPEFPRNQLPQDCHRRVDYLWQRHSSIYEKKRSVCSITYSGVDFLWMAGLLLERNDVPVLSH